MLLLSLVSFGGIVRIELKTLRKSSHGASPNPVFGKPAFLEAVETVQAMTMNADGRIIESFDFEDFLLNGVLLVKSPIGNDHLGWESMEFV